MSLYQSLSEESASRQSSVNGVLIGIVTNIEDPDQIGRVKVKFSIREIETETNWTPVVTMMAGSENGSYFIPSVGDKVVVAFLMGDIEYPFVLGSVWDTEKKPPLSSNPENAIKKIKSTKGHEISMDDSEEGTLTFKTAGGMSITLEDKNKKIEIKTAGGLSVSLDDNSKTALITVGGLSMKMDDSGKKIEIDGGNGKMTLNSQGVKIEGTQINIEGTQVTLKGTQLTIEGTATQIKGSPLMLN